MSKNIFEKRVAIFPEEYPEFLDYVDAINHSYWLHSRWNFQSDLNDFKFKLTPKHQGVIKRTLLAISQIEVNVKTFWGKLYEHFPKPEINSVGASFAESEVRHERAYRKILELLNLQEDFKNLLDVPEIKGRIDYLSKYLSNSGSNNKEKYTLTLALFSLFIENVSLFSQFLIIKLFNKDLNVLKDIDNVIIDTSKEEAVHSMFGAHLIKIIKQENPNWFNEEFNNKIIRACKKAYESELNIIKWIFKEGELDFIKVSELDEYIKQRFNDSLEMIDFEPIFETNQKVLDRFEFFNVEQDVTVHVDFFHKKNPNYSKFNRVISTEELF